MVSAALQFSVEQLVAAVQVLAGDVVEASELSVRLGDSQFARRAYVRAAFALVEGNINLMAELVLTAATRNEVALSSMDIEILRQERSISEVGGVQRVQVKFFPVRDRIGPVMGLFARLYGKTFSLDRSAAGWTRFTAAVNLRNRITHPKDAASFHISGDELDGVEEARKWFADSIEGLLEKCGEGQ